MATGAEEFDALIRLLRATSEEAVPVAENAAAVVYRDAARAAAPRKTGQLAASVKVIEGRPAKGVLYGETRRRLFAGPEKKKGYYGYFVEHGWKAPTGPRVTYTTTRGDRWNPAGHTYTTGRRRRVESMVSRQGGRTASQMGRTSYKKIDAKPWFHRSQRNADSSAARAAETAFEGKMSELDSRVA
jgi:hypothetical protein